MINTWKLKWKLFFLFAVCIFENLAVKMQSNRWIAENFLRGWYSSKATNFKAGLQMYLENLFVEYPCIHI